MCAILITCARAAAHAPPEVLRPYWRAGGALLVLTNRGLIFGGRSDEPFRLMCTEALSISNTERPELALLGERDLIIASSAGLWRSADDGCSWEGVEPFAEVTCTALAQDPTAPDTLYLATFVPGDGGIRVSRDAGVSWDVSLRTEDDDFIQELWVAPSNPAVIYASGYVFAGPSERAHYVARSEDAGANWQRFELALLESESEVVLLPVSSVDAMVLLARTVDREPMQRLLLSRDGGATFAGVAEIELIHDAAFTDAGQTLWVAATQGLLRSVDGGEHFEPLSGPRFMTSVIEHDGALWASGVFGEDQNGIGVSTDTADRFEPRLLFRDVTEPITCDENAHSAVMCAIPWIDWQRELLAPGSSGAASAGAGGAGGAGRIGQGGGAGVAMNGAGAGAATTSGGAGCSVAVARRGSAGPASALLMGVAGLALWRRGRRRLGSDVFPEQFHVIQQAPRQPRRSTQRGTRWRDYGCHPE